MNVKLAAVSAASLVAACSIGTAIWIHRTAVWPNSKLPAGAIFLPSGMRISPVGRQIPLAGDMPLRMTLSDDGKKLMVVTGGYHNHGLTTIDLASQNVDGMVTMTKCTSGLASIDAGHVAISAADEGLEVVDLAAGAATKFGKTEKKAWYGSVVKLPDGSLAASDLNHDQILKIDPTSGDVTASQAVGYRPCALAVSPKGDSLAVAEWGAGTVTFLNATDLKPLATVKAGSHPNSLAYAKDGTLYVANGGSDTVTVVRDGKVSSTVFVSPNPRNLLGSTPDALALSPDDKTLYVADADANCVACVDVANPSRPRVTGFIPTGWYPSALCCSADGKLYVGVGKGLTSRENKDVIGTRKLRSYDQKFTYE
ncbi:MAG TPA: SMP-30/gluconolactonase/LRE family protein, partial [Fimbriimonadaceae bacterium]|nr:SMP-30/gluconolactonase/LRE family protein [Fimbriimonadaceae bacterium]